MRAVSLLALSSLLLAPPEGAPPEGAPPEGAAPEDAPVERAPAPEYEVSTRPTLEGPELPEGEPEVDPRNYRLVLVGDVITGLGVGTFIMMTAGFVVANAASERASGLRSMGDPEDADEVEQLEQRADTGRVVGYVGAGATVALLATGISLIAVGRARERRRRDAMMPEGQARLGSPVPLVGPGGGGVVWRLRF